MKTWNLIIFAMLSTLLVLTSFSEYGMTCQAQETELYPVRVNGKEGYIDATGRVVIKPQFDKVERNFSEGLAPVKIGEKWGYIDKNGKIVISPQFDYAYAFSEGLAVVQIGEKDGFIDKTGKTVINPQFDCAYGFSEGLSRVLIGDVGYGKYGFIDKLGKYIINPQYGSAGSFHKGLAVVMTGSYYDCEPWNHKYWFIDKNGNYYFNQPFGNGTSLDGFSEGLAFVKYDDTQGFIDKTGRLVINTKSYNEVSDFKDGLARVETYNQLDTAYYMSYNNMVGYIDKSGRVVIGLQFDKANDFSDGLACVRIGGKQGIGRYGFINKIGSYVINPQYDYAENFRGGIAPVVINDRFQYIDKKGNVIWTSKESPWCISTSISNLVKMESIFRK